MPRKGAFTPTFPFPRARPAAPNTGYDDHPIPYVRSEIRSRSIET